MADVEIERTKKLALSIKESIETSTQAQRFARIDDLYTKWIVLPTPTYNFFDYLKLALHNFELNSDNLQIGLFEKAKKVVIYELTYLHLFFTKDDISDEVREKYSEKFTKLFRAVIDADNALSSSLYLVSSMTQEEIGREKTTKHELFRYSEIDYDSATAYQSLLLYLFEQLQRKEYRRYVVDEKGMCYSKIYTDEGYDTHAWKQSTTVKNFILDVTRRELNYKMWQNLTNSKENLKAATNYLTEYTGPEFEDLYRDRNIFSFKNGIYISKRWSEEKDTWVDQWIPYTGEGSKKIGASVISCKLFDHIFVDCSNDPDWFDTIKNNCPAFVHIMEYQQWPEEVQRWLCIFIGRMLYEVGELDDWQVIPFLLGMGGTGKCMEKGTPVMLYSGKFEEVQNIKIGDILMGDDNKPRTVLSIHRGYGKMYKIKQKTGDDYVVNGDHILSLKLRKPDLTLKTIDISVKDYLMLDKEKQESLVGYKVPITFPEKKVKIEPYFLGLWLANRLDEYIHPINYEELKNMNIIDNKHIPDIYKYNSPKNQLRLLAGILNVEDNCNKKGNDYFIIHENYSEKSKYIIIQKNYNLAKDIEFIARCLGFTSEIEKCNFGEEILETSEDKKEIDESKEKTIDEIYYSQTISGNILNEIQHLKETLIEIKNNEITTEIEIEPVADDYFFGFQIDGNQRFILGDFTVTHNSTVIDNVVKRLYEDADVGVLGSNIEKKFGLSALVGKKIFIGPEIRGDMSLVQAEFQCMVSGETVSVNTKYKTAHSQKFTAPGFLAGNETMDYKDSAGSITRRIVVFPHDYKVEKGKGDTKLGQKLRVELPYIMQACNRAYLKTIEENAGRGIWDILPQFFKNTQETMAESANALIHFLKSDLVVIGKDHYCREKIFVAAFNDHCKESHFGNTKWTHQFYSGPFADFGIKLNKNCRRRYPNKPNEKSFSGTFLFGVDIKEFALFSDKNNDDDSEICEDNGYESDNMFR